MITEYDNFTYIDDREKLEKLDSSFSNTSSIETSLRELFKDNKEFIAILSGEWGVGKTHFWNNLAPTLMQTDKQVYISLFGLNSIEEIKTNILFKISKFKKSTNWLNKNIVSKFKGLKTVLKLDENVNIPLSMEVLSGLFSLLTQGDFKNIAICFDDIERISDKINIKDFMGLLSELKEKNKCKVIVILNENELDNLSKIDDKPHSEIFALYKEKIVNYEFHYKPSVKDCFNIAKNLEQTIYFDEDKLYNFFTKKEIRNIRVMTQCIYHLNKFSFIKDYDLDIKTIDKFLLNALTAFTFKTIHNLSENKFIEFKEYKSNKSSYDTKKAVGKEDSTEAFEKNSEFEKCLENYNSGSYWYNLEEVIYKYLYSLHIDKSWIKDFLEKENSNGNYQYIGEKLKKLEDEYLYNLQFTKEEYDTQLIDILEIYKKDLFRVLSLEELKIYLDLLDNTLEKNKQNLKQEILENFTTNIMNTQDNELIDKRNSIEEIKNIYPELEQYIEKYRQGYILEEDITSFFSKLIYENKGFLSKKHEMIISNNKDIIIKESIKNKELFRNIIVIIENHSRNSNIESLKEIINEIENKDERYKHKIKKIKDYSIQFQHKIN